MSSSGTAAASLHHNSNPNNAGMVNGPSGSGVISGSSSGGAIHHKKRNSLDSQLAAHKLVHAP